MEPTVNAINTTQEQISPNKEELQITYDALTLDSKDDEFRQAVDDQITRSKSYWNKQNLNSRQETNAKYWKGDQVDGSQLREDQEKWVENAIFRNIETLIPIATSRTPEVSITAAFKNPKTREFAGDIKRMEMAEWEVYQGMQKLVGRGIRNHQITLLGVFKKGYDPDTGEYWTQEIVATDLVISKDGKFVAQYIKDKTLGDIIEMFPEKKADILSHFGLSPNLELTKKLADSPAEFVEVWTNGIVGWKLGDLVLGREKNPHFDYTGEKMNLGTNPDGSPLVQTVKFNYFKKPRHPYLFLTYFNRGIHIFDDTSLIEQGIGPQNWINARKRQIGLNADSTNGHWVSSGDYISFEEFDKIQGSINEKFWLENGKPGEGIAHIAGTPLPDYIYNDLQDSRGALDNLMGTHSTTRGEVSGSKTATQDLLAKDQDYGRADGYVRDGIEVLAQQWYEYDYHLHLVYGTKEKSIAIPEDNDFENDNVIFSRSRVPLVQLNDGELIPVPLVIRVKQGSTLPMDEVAEFQKAQKAKDILAPMDYFKMTGEANPRELAKNFLLWTNDPFSFFADDPDIQAMMQKKQAEAQAQAQAEAQAAAAKGQQDIALKDKDIKAKMDIEAMKQGMPVEGEGDGPSGEGVMAAMASMVKDGEVPEDVVANMMGGM